MCLTYLILLCMLCKTLLKAQEIDACAENGCLAACSAADKSTYDQCYESLKEFMPLISQLRSPLGGSRLQPSELLAMCRTYGDFVQCSSGVTQCKSQDPQHKFVRSLLYLICADGIRQLGFQYQDCLTQLNYQASMRGCFMEFEGHFRAVAGDVFSNATAVGVEFCEFPESLHNFTLCAAPIMRSMCERSATSLIHVLNQHVQEISWNENCSVKTDSLPACTLLQAEKLSFCKLSFDPFQHKIDAETFHLLDVTQRRVSLKEICIAHFLYLQCKKAALEDHPCVLADDAVAETEKIFASFCNQSYSAWTQEAPCFSPLDQNTEVNNCVVFAYNTSNIRIGSTLADVHCAVFRTLRDLVECLKPPVESFCGIDGTEYAGRFVETTEQQLRPCQDTAVGDPVQVASGHLDNIAKGGVLVLAEDPSFNKFPPCDHATIQGCLKYSSIVNSQVWNLTLTKILAMHALDQQSLLQQTCAAFIDPIGCFTQSASARSCRIQNPFYGYLITIHDLACGSQTRSLVFEHSNCLTTLFGISPYLCEADSQKLTADLNPCTIAADLTRFKTCLSSLISERCSQQDQQITAYLGQFSAAVNRDNLCHNIGQYSGGAYQNSGLEINLGVDGTTTTKSVIANQFGYRLNRPVDEIGNAAILGPAPTTGKPITGIPPNSPSPPPFSARQCANSNSFDESTKCMTAYPISLTVEDGFFLTEQDIRVECDRFLKLEACLREVSCVPKYWPGLENIYGFICQRGEGGLWIYTDHHNCLRQVKTRMSADNGCYFVDFKAMATQTFDSICQRATTFVNCIYGDIVGSCGPATADYIKALAVEFAKGFEASCKVSTDSHVLQRPLPNGDDQSYRGAEIANARFTQQTTTTVTAEPRGNERNQRYSHLYLVIDQPWKLELSDTTSDEYRSWISRFQDFVMRKLQFEDMHIESVEPFVGKIRVFARTSLPANVTEAFMVHKLTASRGSADDNEFVIETLELKEVSDSHGMLIFISGCDKADIEKAKQCVTSIEHIGDEITETLLKNLPLLEQSLQNLYADVCNRYDNILTCLNPIVSRPACTIQSCVVQSLGAACEHRQSVGPLIGCLLKTITQNHTALGCALDLVSGEGDISQKDRVLRLIDCLHPFVSSSCGPSAVDFLNSISAAATPGAGVESCQRVEPTNLAVRGNQPLPAPVPLPPVEPVRGRIVVTTTPPSRPTITTTPRIIQPIFISTAPKTTTAASTRTTSTTTTTTTTKTAPLTKTTTTEPAVIIGRINETTTASAEARANGWRLQPVPAQSAENSPYAPPNEPYPRIPNADHLRSATTQDGTRGETVTTAGSDKGSLIISQTATAETTTRMDTRTDNQRQNGRGNKLSGITILNIIVFCLILLTT